MKTKFKDSLNKPIKIGDTLDIIATTMYSGIVNIKDGVICIDTMFFNESLASHLSAIDFKFCHIRSHGGHRVGSGRKSKPPTETINFRIPKSDKEKLKVVPELTKKFKTWYKSLL